MTVAVLAPLPAPGYLLLRDAVSTPRSYLSDAALGLGESAPRAVPQDFAVALGSHLVGGGVVVKALLIVGVWLAGAGAARLVSLVLPAAGLAGQLVAATVAIWNPYVAERLLQGHWSLLVGYGCLPWVAAAMLALRSANRPALFPLMCWLALAGLTPTGLILAATVALTCVAIPGPGRPRRYCAAAALAVTAVAAAPWVIASLPGPSSAPAAGAGVAAFAARAEPGLGTLASLGGLGGIWNAEAVPASRTTGFALVATLVLLGVVAAGLPVLWRRPAARPLLVLAAVAVLVPAALASGPGIAVLTAAIDAAPGLGVLRDGQKWVGLAMPGYALAGAGAVLGLGRLLPAVAATALCTALIAVLPDLAFGVGGRLTPVHYPPGWPAVAALINADPRPVAVLPAGDMRRFAWAPSAPVLDPLPRWVRADVLATGDLTVSGRVVPGEGSRARAVQALLAAGADPVALADAGVGWVVVEAPATHAPAGLPVAYRDADLALYRAGGEHPGAAAGWRRAALAAHLSWLALLAAGAVGAGVTAWRRRSQRA